MGDKCFHRSHTGFWIFYNTALISWYSKKQSTIETFIFNTEFVAVKTDIETLQGICYEMHAMGVPIAGATHIC